VPSFKFQGEQEGQKIPAFREGGVPLERELEHGVEEEEVEEEVRTQSGMPMSCGQLAHRDGQQAQEERLRVCVDCRATQEVTKDRPDLRDAPVR
jgi:hypothetical protein